LNVIGSATYPQIDYFIIKERLMGIYNANRALDYRVAEAIPSERNEKF